MARRSVKMVVSGIAELDKDFHKLEPNLQRKYMRQAMRAGLKPMLAAAKANEPGRRIRRFIKLRAGKKSRWRIRMNIIVSQDKFPVAARSGKPQWYPQAVEFGLRKTRHYQARHPFERAFNATNKQASATCIDLIWAGIAKELQSSP